MIGIGKGSPSTDTTEPGVEYQTWP